MTQSSLPRNCEPDGGAYARTLRRYGRVHTFTRPRSRTCAISLRIVALHAPVGMSALQHDDFGYLFVKVARINIFGTVVAGSQRKLWKNSKLHASGGWWGGEDVVTPNWVPSVFMDGAELGETMFDGLSLNRSGRAAPS